MLARTLEVPVPVWLHPGLVYAKLLPVLVARSHMVGNPVQALLGCVAVGGQSRRNYFPVLVLAVDINVVREVYLL